jgi:FtsP/CotA-like multicopper oxidase with cupredoxin domain
MANMEYLSIEKRGESRTLLPYSTQRPGKGRTWAVRAGLLLAAAAVLFVAGVRASSAGAGVADMAEKLTQENQDRNQATSDFSPGSLGFGFGLNMLQEVAEAPKNEETGCYRLNVAVGTAEVGIAAPFRARLYNGAYLGGLLRASAAHGLKVELSNTLAPDTTDASLAAAERHPWNAYRLPNHTNLHVHGMHVSPSAPADDVYTTLNGGEAKTYTYHVSADLPAGLFWYHPHAHGATSLQQGGGWPARCC